MAEAAEKMTSNGSENKPSNKGKVGNATNFIKRTNTDEIVIALCGPIGSPLHDVADQIKRSLISNFEYHECNIIKLSDLIKKYNSGSVDSTTKFNEVNSLIKAGNALREKHGSSVLAELAIKDIALNREGHTTSEGHSDPKPRRVCHIIDSIKNQEELGVLKAVYREMLYFVGVFSPLTAREESLKNNGLSGAQIHQLIDRDSGEEFDHGQTVRDTFPEADFFLRIDSGTRSHLNQKVDRFLNLILGSKIITPTNSETAMYMAASAASNSACLSRQVGAALTDAEGKVISVGWNDVPKYGGGLYEFDSETDPGSTNDHRCWNNPGLCSNDSEKNIIANEVAQALLDSNLISLDKKDDVAKALRKQPKLKGLIEFSRAVHAEMHAIVSASASGRAMSNGKLYCTTYPCHSCARHIIAAGITEVFYIEPYRKSLATKLHGDAITEDENQMLKVRILPYEGVAPNRYLQLFRMHSSRKDPATGKFVEAVRSAARPKVAKTLEALPALEAVVVQGLTEKNLNNDSGAIQ